MYKDKSKQSVSSLNPKTYGIILVDVSTVKNMFRIC